MRGRPVSLYVVVVLALAASSFAGGKYVMAFWRELGAAENQAPPYGEFGNHSIFISVFDENGNALEGVPLGPASGGIYGSTNYRGFLEVPVYTSADYYTVRVWDGANDSDVSPPMTTRRWPNWGHYSWNIGFMYKADANSPGTYDTDIIGTVNSEGSSPYELDAPCTESLAYYSTVPTEYTSDQYALFDNWAGELGQTFVANGDRVMACKFQMTRGFLQHLTWYAQILEGGPGGAPVGPQKMVAGGDQVSDEYWPIMVFWGVNDNPVVPGQTYYVKLTAPPNGCNAWVMGVQDTGERHDTYPGGCFYKGGVAQPDTDLMGLVVCMNYESGAPTGTIAGHVENLEGEPLDGALVTATPGGYSDDSDLAGNYSIINVPVGTYDLTCTLAGYQSASVPGVEVLEGETTVVNFTLTPLSNFLVNPGFETGDLTGWTTWGSVDGVIDGPWFNGVDAHSGTYFLGSAASYGTKNGGVWQQAYVPAAGDYEASVWAWTWQRGGQPSDCVARLGVDPTGGTDYTAGTVQWTNWVYTNAQWQQLTKQVSVASPRVVTVFLQFQQTWAIEWHVNGFDDAVLAALAPPEGSIAGTVRDLAGQPLAGVAVWTTGASDTTGPDGMYELAGLAPGDYTVFAAKTGYADFSGPATVVAGETTTLDVTLVAVEVGPTFPAGWNLLSVPLVPEDPEASAVFDDLVAAGNVVTNALYTYVPESGYALYPLDFTDVSRGLGYWLKITVPAGETLNGTRALGPVAVPLGEGWNLVGLPQCAPVALADCSVTQGATTLSFEDAAGAGWVSPYLYGYTPGGGYYMVHPTDPEYANDLEPWCGYWLRAHVAGLELIVPLP